MKTKEEPPYPNDYAPGIAAIIALWGILGHPMGFNPTDNAIKLWNGIGQERRKVIMGAYCVLIEDLDFKPGELREFADRS